VGYVVAVHYPGDKDHEKDKEILYDAVCMESDGLDTSSWRMFSNLRLGIRLGGSVQDFSFISLRSPKSKYLPSKGLTQEQRTESSCVLIECENGMSNAGIIVGFSRHADLPVENKALGHNYRWDFNGISTTINQDGEYQVIFSGGILDPNNNTYIAPPADTTGTYLKFTKTGNLVLDDAKGESITLDKAGKALSIVARAMNVTVTEKDYNLTSKGKTVIKATGNAVFNSGKKIYIGKEGSTEPLVLGNKLAAALKALVDILSVPVIGQAIIPCVSALTGPLTGWAALYTTKNVAPFLSKKGYVE
jgi:hypothetical protein